MRKTHLVLIAAILIFGGGYLLLSGSGKTDDPLVLGFLSPLTGPVASVGQSTRLAAQIAVDEINDQGGFNGRKIRFVMEDSKCDPKESTTAATKLINIDRVTGIIGDLCSNGTLAIAPLAEQSNVVLISHGSTAAAVSRAGEYVFRVVPSDSFQGKFAAEYVFHGLKKVRVVILVSQDDYATGISSVFQERFTELGGDIVLFETIGKDQKDFRVQIQKLKEANPDVLYTPLFPANAIAFYRQLKEFGIQQQIVSTDLMEDASILGEAGEAAEGIVYTIPYQPDQSELERKMKSRNSDAVVVFGTPQAYDTVKLLAKIIDEVGTDPSKIKDALYKTRYDGISGTIEFDANGDLTAVRYSVMKIIDGKRVNIQ